MTNLQAEAIRAEQRYRAELQRVYGTRAQSMRFKRGPHDDVQCQLARENCRAAVQRYFENADTQPIDLAAEVNQ